jgi:phospholipid/cholesterol/gamma-HCH transport system substrate-binding protein
MRINNETKIGIFVVIVLLILAVSTWKTGDYQFAPKGYELKIQFKDIDGVELNAPVTLNGLEVGRVKDINILYGEATRVEIILWMKEEAKVHEGAKAYVKNMGFLGEKYVAVTTGDDGTPFLKSGTVIIGEEPADFQSILADGEVIAANIKEISQAVNERLKVNSAAIDSIIADMRTSMTHITSISSNIDKRFQVNDHLVDDAISNLNLTSKNLEEMSCDLKQNPWKLLYKPKTRPCPK